MSEAFNLTPLNTNGKSVIQLDEDIVIKIRQAVEQLKSKKVGVGLLGRLFTRAVNYDSKKVIDAEVDTDNVDLSVKVASFVEAAEASVLESLDKSVENNTHEEEISPVEEPKNNTNRDDIEVPVDLNQERALDVLFGYIAGVEIRKIINNKFAPNTDTALFSKDVGAQGGDWSNEETYKYIAQLGEKSVNELSKGEEREEIEGYIRSFMDQNYRPDEPDRRGPAGLTSGEIEDSILVYSLAESFETSLDLDADEAMDSAAQYMKVLGEKLNTEQGKVLSEFMDVCEARGYDSSNPKEVSLVLDSLITEEDYGNIFPQPVVEDVKDSSRDVDQENNDFHADKVEQLKSKAFSDEVIYTDEERYDPEVYIHPNDISDDLPIVEDIPTIHAAFDDSLPEVVDINTYKEKKLAEADAEWLTNKANEEMIDKDYQLDKEALKLQRSAIEERLNMSRKKYGLGDPKEAKDVDLEV